MDIMTKAVCGRGKKLGHSYHELPTSHSVCDVLGCWVFNHCYSAKKEGDKVIVKGSYTIHLWFSFDNQTKTDVAESNVSYEDKIPVSVQTEELISDDLEVIVKMIQQPNCVDTEIKDHSKCVRVKIERELLAIVMGETFIRVQAEDAKKIEKQGHNDFRPEADQKVAESSRDTNHTATHPGKHALK